MRKSSGMVGWWERMKLSGSKLGSSPLYCHTTALGNSNGFVALTKQQVMVKGVLLSWGKRETSADGRNREVASLSARSLLRQENKHGTQGDLGEQKHQANSGTRLLPTPPYLHLYTALYPCFLRNNYKAELKSISWSREWPVWKFSDISELRLCQ